MTGVEMAGLIGWYIGAFGVGYAASMNLLIFKQTLDKST